MLYLKTIRLKLCGMLTIARPFVSLVDYNFTRAFGLSAGGTLQPIIDRPTDSLGRYWHHGDSFCWH